MGYLDNKQVFLAGATGSVGFSVMGHILENYPTTRIKACYHTRRTPMIEHERVRYIRADLRSQDECRRAVRGCNCAIMAAARTAGSDVSVNRPWELVNDNVTMNTQMLEAFNSEGIERVIFISSSTAYQEFDGYIREDDLDLNREPHPAYLGVGWVFRFVEKLCRFWHEKSTMDIIIARASNPFGPYAKFDPKTSNFIPAIIRKAVERMDPFEVWGRPDVTRDVIYSKDFSRAIAMMMDDDRISFDIFNIGYGSGTTVKEVVQWALEYAAHRPSEIKYNLDKPTTIKFRVLDCSKVKDVLGWQPQYTVEQGIEETTKWWTENRERWKR